MTREMENIVTNWETAKEFVMPRLTTTMDVSNLVTMEMMDLTVYFAVSFGEKFVKVTKDIQQMWNVTATEIAEAAIDNVKRETVYKTLQEMLLGLGGAEQFVSEDATEMYCITNRTATFGASAVLNYDVLDKVREKLGNIYLLPSSVHEMLIVSESIGSASELAKIVQEINADKDIIADEDFLSDSVYFYNGSLSKIC